MPETPPSSHDPYEYGFDVAQRRRLPIPDLEPPPEPGRRKRRPARDVWKFALAGLALVTVFAVARGVQQDRAAALKADCSRAQLKVAEKSVVSRGTGLLHWSATGAPGTRYVVAINASTVTVAGQVATAQPASGSAGQASRVQMMGHGCLGHGVFGVLLPAGTYPVTLFRIDGTAATDVAHTSLRVTAP